MSKKLTTEEFVLKAKKVHGDKYDYVNVVYNRNKNKVKITCPIHGMFSQLPCNHLSGRGCNMCAVELKSNNRRKTKYEFETIANIIHNYKFDYKKTAYVSSRIKVTITCPVHGDFIQLPTNHLKYGCKKCATEYNKLKMCDFIKIAKKIHSDFYDYSLVNFSSNKSKINIICPKHGVFLQSVNIHLCGHGCQKCGGSTKLTTEQFIKNAKKIHGNTYNYSLTDYINQKVKVKIICNIHGTFIQKPSNHLAGHNCPNCITNSKGEIQIKSFLEKNNINFIPQYKFNDCIHPKTKWKLSFDFYLKIKFYR